MADVSRRILLGTAVLFAAWYGVELMRTPSPLPEPDSGESASSTLELPNLDRETPLLAEFSNTLERPLFNSTRRPLEQNNEESSPDTVAATPNTAMPLRLSAVIINEQERSALLEEPKTRELKLIKQGDVFLGWTLEEVREDSVALSSGEQRSDLALRTFEPPPAVPRSRKAREPRRLPGEVTAAVRRARKLPRRPRRETTPVPNDDDQEHAVPPQPRINGQSEHR